MSKAIIYFSDKSIIELHEGECIIPIVRNDIPDDSSASMAKTITLSNHIHNGLIPSIMDAFVECDFFYINHDYNVVYNSRSIVKIELS